MTKQSSANPVLNVIGLMSGTSVDSIDAACVRIQMAEDPLRLTEYTLLGTATTEYDASLREQLLSMMANPTVNLADLCHCQAQVAEAFAEAAQNLIEEMAAQGYHVDLISSHGQTLYHIPPEPDKLGCTLQIGQPAIIAERTGIDVVGDFRPRDMAAGGQGAPLVPFADMLLFRSETEDRAALNIGGIANITVLPSNPDTPIFAFDTGPGNMMIDAFMDILFSQPYDPHGKTAQKGQIFDMILESWLADPYLKQPPPKSTGREHFGTAMVQAALDQWRPLAPPEDWVATATYYTAQTITQAIEQFVLPKVPIKEVIASGGGIHNITLMQWLGSRLGAMGITLKTADDYGISSRYKEAIAFALLGYATKIAIPNNIPSCTGASHPLILGGFWPGKTTVTEPHDRQPVSVERSSPN